MLSPKRYKLADDLEIMIREQGFRPGDPLPPQEELAARFGVSRTCLYRACALLENRGVIVRHQGKGVFVSDGKSPKPLKNVAVLLWPTQKLEPNRFDNYGLNIFLGLEAELHARKIGCQLMRPSLERPLQSIFEDFENFNIDGIIVCKKYPEEFIGKLMQCELPIVSVEREMTLCSSVSPDFYHGFKLLLRRLYFREVRRICFFYPEGAPHSGAALAACAEMQHELLELRLERHEYLNGAPYTVNDDSYIHDAIDNVVATNQLPEVFITLNDWTAFQIIRELRRHNLKVPANVEVTGAFGIELSRESSPTITTLALNTAELGAAAVTLLHEVATSRPAIPITRKIPLVAVENQSCRLKLKKQKGKL